MLSKYLWIFEKVAMQTYRHIWIITGWESSERDISLKSAQSVTDALDGLGKYTTIFYDLPEDTSSFLSAIQTWSIDLCFVMIHGAWWEDWQIVGLLDLFGIPYQCTTRDVLALTSNKRHTKLVRSDYGIPTARDICLIPWQLTLDDISSKVSTFWLPCVWKELDQGSSQWVHIIRSHEDIDHLYKQYLSDSSTKLILLEEFLEWDEITVAILEIEWIAQALPVVHIIPPSTWWFNYENKYNWSTQEICPPVEISQDLIEQSKTIALEAYHAVWCTRYARVDIIITSSGPTLLEINTIPWFTTESLYPKAALAYWISFQELLEILIKQ